MWWSKREVKRFLDIKKLNEAHFTVYEIQFNSSLLKFIFFYLKLH